MENICKVTESVEGRATIRHCDLSAYVDARGFVDPAWAPVFYNPRMRCSRDISTVIVSVYAKFIGRSDLHVVDVMCGTGVRGIRYALEVPGVVRVTLNDANPRAVDFARKNVSVNSLTDIVGIENQEAHSLLASMKADIIDVDPFGTPAPYVHPAIMSLRHNGLLCVTATDLPPLLGIYPAACMRKYFSFSINSEFSKEQAVRILLYFIAREAAKLGRKIEPFYAYYLDHHVRVCVIVKKSSKSSFLEENVGFIHYNTATLERRPLGLLDLFNPNEEVSKANNIQVGGPVWLGPLWREEIVAEVEKEYSSRINTFNLCKRGSRLVGRILEEYQHKPFYYVTEKIASTYKLSSEVSPDEIIQRLNSLGYPSSHTHFDPKGFRTHANVRAILEAWQR